MTDAGLWVSRRQRPPMLYQLLAQFENAFGNLAPFLV